MKRGIPRFLLICCEGSKTEVQYFYILKEIYRLGPAKKIEILGGKGQHKSLIDKTAAKRKECSEEFGLDENEIECWAVCDDDNMSISYTELHKYASEYSINLGFSRPFFEAYLAQHFEPFKHSKKESIFLFLTGKRNEQGYSGDYCDATKGDLAWIRQAILDKPKLIDNAINNSNIRSSSIDPLFLTVQNLSARLKELEDM